MTTTTATMMARIWLAVLFFGLLRSLLAVRLLERLLLGLRLLLELRLLDFFLVMGSPLVAVTKLGVVGGCKELA